MNNNPRISVLMPVYNTPEEFLRPAIESVLAQTFTDYEFLIINDGSTNDAEAVIKSYDDPRIKYIAHEKNMKLIATLNEGLDIARGEYIARMDGDDISLPERFARQVEFMDANPNVGLLGTNIEIIGDIKTPQFRERVHFMDILAGWTVCHPTFMMRREMFEKFGLRYAASALIAEDYELISRAVRYFEIRNLPEKLFKYRWHESNESVAHRERQMQSDREIKRAMLEFLTGNPKLHPHIFTIATLRRGALRRIWYAVFPKKIGV